MSTGRKATPRGQMTRGANSGPAIMLMPPHIRATFMPNPPLEHIPLKNKRRKQQWSGMTPFLQFFEKSLQAARADVTAGSSSNNKQQPLPPKSEREINKERKRAAALQELEPKIEEYRKEQKLCGGEYEGMNCYNTLFAGRLAYEVTERKLLREMETFGPVKDIKIIKDKEGKSRGYAFVEYEHEEDMKRAYRAADGMRIEGREIVADVERGHTVPSWLPRRLGGGLGGTRLGGRDVNVTRPGRFDPSRPDASVPVVPMGGMGRGALPPPPANFGYGGPPPAGRGSGFRDGPPPPLRSSPPYGAGGRGGGFGDRYGGPPPPRGWEGGPPPPRGWDGGPPPPRDGGPPPPRDWDRRKRPRSRSPDRHYGGGDDRRRRF